MLADRPQVDGVSRWPVIGSVLTTVRDLRAGASQDAFCPCPRGERPLVELYLEPGVFSERCTEKLPLRVDCIHRREFGEVSGHRVLIKRGPGNRGPTECGTTHEATSGTSS